jgi:RNA polymerase primary sigma factor
MQQLIISKQITQRDDDAINRYFQEINKFPLITAEEEAELAGRIRAGDNHAMEKLVLANLRFVISVAKQYQNNGLSFADLINEGNLGLVKAAKRFDETRGFKFISYAVWWIRQSIIQAISEQTRIVRLPLNRLSSINKIKKAIPYLEQEFEREPTNAELAGYLEIKHADVELANSIKKQQVSFDKPISTESENEFSLYDIIQTGDIPSPDNNLMTESVTTNINRALSKLSAREAKILTMSYGLSNSPVYSLNDMAVQFDMSAERIRQIRRTSLFKLKSLLQGKYNFLVS